MMKEIENKRGYSIPFIVKIIGWAVLNYTIWEFDPFFKENARLGSVAHALNSFLTMSIVFSIGRYLIITLYNKRHANKSVRGNFVLGINRVTVILNTTTAIICVMGALGIDPREFVTSMTIVAMAVAVTFREYITNMISGLIIMFSDELSVGDRVKIGSHKGRIVDITFSSLIIQDEEDDMVMVPNNLVFTAAVVNLSAHRSSLFMVKFELPLKTAIEVDKLEETIQATLLNHPNLTGDDELRLQVMEIGKDYVKYKIEMHAVSSSNKLHRQLENEILKEVLKFEREAPAEHAGAE